MKDWALILGASSGFGAAAAKKLAAEGINIFGVHLDRRSAHSDIQNLIKELKKNNVNVVFKNMNATDDEKINEVIEELLSFKNIRIKIFLHSLAFGTLKPMIPIKNDVAILNQSNLEMTASVMAHSLVKWTQTLIKNKLLKKGSQVFAMTSAGGRKQWMSYGAVSAAKASLESYCRQLALELSSVNIAVNAIQAGVTKTPALEKIPGHIEMIDNALKVNPGKRLTLPEDVAHIINILGKSEQTWLTGNTIRVDGGEDITN